MITDSDSSQLQDVFKCKQRTNRQKTQSLLIHDQSNDSQSVSASKSNDDDGDDQQQEQQDTAIPWVFIRIDPKMAASASNGRKASPRKGSRNESGSNIIEETTMVVSDLEEAYMNVLKFNKEEFKQQETTEVRRKTHERHPTANFPVNLGI